jgi:MFS family permease
LPLTSLVGAAPNIYVLIASRLVQGIGGGGVDVLAEIIVNDIASLRKEYLHRLVEHSLLWALFWILRWGALLTYFSWRWVADRPGKP